MPPFKGMPWPVGKIAWEDRKPTGLHRLKFAALSWAPVAAIHVVAVCQARDPGPGREHYRRKLAQTKTPNEARRSLKRRLSNVIYRRILADLRRTQRAAT